MSKYSLKEIWNKIYGNANEIYDYAGRKMIKSAIGDRNSSYHPTIEHIRPLTLGGLDVLDNIVICNRLTNQEKADCFPHWKANGKRFHARRVKGFKSSYNIILE